MWHPIKPKHSIESVCWRVVTLQPLVQRHQKLVIDNDTALRGEMPRVEVSQRFLEVGPAGQVNYSDSEHDAMGEHVPAFLRYARHTRDGQVESVLEASGQSISVVNHQYSRWEKVSEDAYRALSFFCDALGKSGDPLHVAELELEYKDAFWWEGTWRKDALAELLSHECGFVPQRAFQGGHHTWHAEQGWIVKQPLFGHEEMVERMFMQGLIGTVDNKPKPVLVLHTTLRWCPGSGVRHLPLTLQDALDGEKEASIRNTAPQRFKVMHDRALRMFEGALTQPVRDEVGL